MSTSNYTLDDVDHRIIDFLGEDGRMSNRQLAAELGVTEGTIRTRIKRLQNENLMQFSVVTGFELAGSPNLVMFGIHADPNRVPNLAREIAEIPEIGGVIILLGRYSIMATGLFQSVEDVENLVRERMRTLQGVRSVEVTYSIRPIKYDFRIARLTQRKGTVADAGDD